jgi:predicted metalloprotease with PDZ domain
MNDIDRVPITNATVAGNSAAAGGTINSMDSLGSTSNLGLNTTQQTNLQSQSAKSVGNLTTAQQQQQQQQQQQKPKFKRCLVVLPQQSDSSSSSLPHPQAKGYGFTLNSKVKPKYMIFSVDPVSPAYAANLRATDVIVEINKKNIRRLKFDQVKQMIIDSQKERKVEILAISKEGYMYYKERRKRFSSRKLVTLDNTEPYSSLNGGISAFNVANCKCDFFEFINQHSVIVFSDSQFNSV